jgi:hypothetical protein
MPRGNGEAVVFNQSPIISMLLRDQQEKQLKSQYLDKTIQADMSKLSPDGIRPDDIPAYTKAYQGMQDAGMKYRALASSTKNPMEKAAAYNDFQQSLVGVRNLINESKSAKERYKSAVGFYGTNHDKIDADAFTAGLNDLRAPIGTAEYERGRNFDATSAIFNPKTFETQKWQMLLNTVKPVDKITAREIGTGQQDVSKIKYTDPNALATVAGQGFDSDYGHSKKFYTTQLEHASADEIQSLEGYAQKHLAPNFKIQSPRDYAIANALYGNVEKDMGRELKGSPWKSQQAFQAAQQQRAFAHSDALQQRSFNHTANSKGPLWEATVADAIKRGDTEKARGLLTELETSLPGTEYGLIKQGQSKVGLSKDMLNNMKVYGQDGQTRRITEQDYKDGVVWVSIPKINPKTKKVVYVKDAKGNPTNIKAIQVLAVKASDPHIINRLGKLRDFVRGGKPKGVSDVIYGPATNIPNGKVGLGAFDAETEENEMPAQDINENEEEEQ